MVDSVILDGTEFTEASFAGENYANPDTGILAFGAAVVGHGANLHEGESTTSMTIGAGTKIAEITAARPIFPGSYVEFVDAADAANRMGGEVDSYDKVTGDITFTVSSDYAGSGTISDWLVYCQGKRGRQGDPGDIASQAEAEAGTNNSKVMTPLRVAQAIDAQAGLVLRATVTTATTLTASDGNLVPINMGSAGQSVTLPDATTLADGKPYLFRNIGSREAGIRSSDGVLIARCGAGKTISVTLTDNGTAAGSWAVEGDGALLPLLRVDRILSSTLTTAVQASVALTSEISLHFGRSAAGLMYVWAQKVTPTGTQDGAIALVTGSSADLLWVQRLSDIKAMIAISGGGTVLNIAVDPSTLACTPSSTATATGFGGVRFSSAALFQLACSLSSNLHVAANISGGAVIVQAVDSSGTVPSVGSSVNIVASGGQHVLAVYPVTATTAQVIYIDDSGTAGSPFSLRTVVVSVSGTTCTVGTSAGINDVIDGSAYPAVNLTPGSSVVMYADANDGDVKAVHLGASGTTSTAGTPLVVEAGTFGLWNAGSMSASRYAPLLYPLNNTQLLATYPGPSGGDPVRHAVITNSAGTLSAGFIVQGLVVGLSNGVNLPQRPTGFLIARLPATSSPNGVFAVEISGSTLTVAGWVEVPESPGALTAQAQTAFGLSGGHYGLFTSSTSSGETKQLSLHYLRWPDAGPPSYVGKFAAPAMSTAAAMTPLRSNQLAYTATTVAQVGATALVKLAIWEFPL